MNNNNKFGRRSPGLARGYMFLIHKKCAHSQSHWHGNSGRYHGNCIPQILQIRLFYLSLFFKVAAIFDKLYKPLPVDCITFHWSDVVHLINLEITAFRIFKICHVFLSTMILELS